MMRVSTCASVFCLVLAVTGRASAQLVDDVSHVNAIAHYRVGDELLRDEQFVRAAAEFQAAVTLDPLLTIAHYGLGQSFMALKQYPDAIRAYIGCRTAFQSLAALIVRDDFAADQRRDDEIRELRQAIGDLQSSQGPIVGGREATILRLEHRISDLERTRQRGNTSFDTPAELSLALGSAYFRSGDLTSAERAWKAAVAVNGRLGEAHNNLAALYAMTGRKLEAQESVRQAERAGYKVNPKLKSDIQAIAAGSPR